MAEKRRIRELLRAINIEVVKIENGAFKILENIEKESYLPGRSLDDKAVLSIIFAMRKYGRQVDIDKILCYAYTNKQKIKSGYKILKKTEIFKEMETRIMAAEIVKSKSKLLGLKPKVKEAAELIARNFTKHCIEEGKKPATIAGVSFFMAIDNFGDLHSDSDDVWTRISGAVSIGV